ncbi:MAG: hypothetical protein HOP11_12165 [Saprospiraceae bacterium]|nr:hypothetical protein [Saprospiraceae bacterium]
MNKITAIKIMLWLLAIVMLFHLSILLRIIPYEITWGGRLKRVSEMYIFESISFIINLILFLILMIKGGYISKIIPNRVVDIILWIFLALFALNTIGNLFAISNFEKFFSVLTLASSILLWIILKKEKRQTHNRA